MGPALWLLGAGRGWDRFYCTMNLSSLHNKAIHSVRSYNLPTVYFSLSFAVIETIGLLNVISIFVVIGIGLFVFVNTFKHSTKLPGLHDRYDRITHTILEATKATFFTSLTTSVAFLANVVSSVSSCREGRGGEGRGGEGRGGEGRGGEGRRGEGRGGEGRGGEGRGGEEGGREGREGRGGEGRGGEGRGGEGRGGEVG